MMVIEERVLDDWRFLLRDLEDVTSGDLLGRDLVFRGQRVSDWGLVTSFDRRASGSLKRRNERFTLCMEQFKTDAAHILPNALPLGDLISLAQHYGLPTRVLDWSYSPYIGLFFAETEAVSTNQTKPAALWIMNRKKVSEEIDENEFVFVEYSDRKDDRILSQKGLFSMLKIDQDDLEAFFREKKIPGLLRKVTITPNCFEPLSRHLRAMDLGSGPIDFGRFAWFAATKTER
ncbi:FRG domain-containing protein [Sedimentitalea arenosa]|uniref:FRG domain-containing protein n=1 Tax=Sedimentitalea arenosa TaxID=2798803 RepID=A0A8J7J3R3_9RHOB|nr:FRG domain-containing protein [Arenibacterium arenosum]MBJ6373120.1 FRG domain-containing protein [Arenibacterium arenosum]